MRTTPDNTTEQGRQPSTTGSTITFKENYQDALSVIRFVEKHPRVTSAQSVLPVFITRPLQGDCGSVVFQIAVLLNLMGLEDQVSKLQGILASNAPGLEKPEAKLAYMQSHLYGLFDLLSKEECLEDHLSSLKKLKKLIHEFSRINGSEGRLFNLKKLEIQFKDEKKALGEKIAEDGSNTEATNKLLDVNKGLFLVKQLQNKTVKDKNRKDDKKAFKRYYAHISDEDFKILFPKQGNAEAYKALREKQRRKRRREKLVLDVVSFTISVILGVGEGIVAAFLLSAALPILPLVIIVGVAAVLGNYYLIRGDSFKILKDFYYGKIWKREDGTKLSKKEIAFVVGSLAFSFGAGCAFGFLSFGSGMIAFTAIFAAIGISTGPIGIMIVAGIIAVVTAGALFFIFTHMTVTWIRTGGPERLKNKILNSRKNFINFCRPDTDDPLWYNNSNIFKKAWYIAKKMSIVLGTVLVVAIAVAAVVLVNVATIGQFKNFSVSIFHGTMGLTMGLSNILSYGLIVGLGGVVTSIFYGKGVLTVLDIGVGMAKSTWNAIRHPIRTYKELKADWRSVKSNPIRLIHGVATLLKRAVVYLCVALNAFGQGNGVRHNPTALAWVHGVTRLPTGIASRLNQLVMSGGSFGPNYCGGANATKGEGNVFKVFVRQKSQSSSEEEGSSEGQSVAVEDDINNKVETSTKAIYAASKNPHAFFANNASGEKQPAPRKFSEQRLAF